MVQCSPFRSQHFGVFSVFVIAFQYWLLTFNLSVSPYNRSRISPYGLSMVHQSSHIGFFIISEVHETETSLRAEQHVELVVGQKAAITTAELGQFLQLRPNLHINQSRQIQMATLMSSFLEVFIPFSIIWKYSVP